MEDVLGARSEFARNIFPSSEANQRNKKSSRSGLTSYHNGLFGFNFPSMGSSLFVPHALVKTAVFCQ